MRYPEAKIKEAILHPDQDVRDTAIRYFYSSTNPDHTLMPLAIQAIERYGRINTFSFTHYLNLLPQTEQTIRWVIAELQGDFEGPPEEWHFFFYDLSRLLCHADLPLVAQHASDVLHAPHFVPQERLAFSERLEMLEWKAERCWQELQQFCEANKDKNNLEDIELGHALRLVEALARQPHEYQRQIVALLAEKADDFRHGARKWLQPLMANLAGQMRFHEAIPSLIANLNHPYNFLADESMFALIKIGSDDVVAAVCDQFRHGPRDVRLRSSDLLCKIHLDATVQRVLELLPGETDLAVRLNLCEALLDHFSDEGIEPARQLIMEQQPTPDVRRLRRCLIAVCKIMGIRFPEFDVWQEQGKVDAQEEWAEIQKIQKMAYEAGGDMALLARKQKAQIAELQAKGKMLEAQIADLEAEKKRREAEIAKKEKLLARRHTPRPTRPDRIGRNDPCLCGSGKKFKHCCMR
jgi:hypothetical protein